MSVLGVIVLLIIFCISEMILMKKSNKKLIKYLPTSIGVMGVLLSLMVRYFSYIPFWMGIYSQSVLLENQYFALMICVLFTPCLIGGIFGIVLYRFLGRKQILYFIPFIFSVIVYLAITVLGLGPISLKEILWIVLFLVSGLLLSNSKISGGLLGMIPGIVFIWMSTNDTGQVINAEMPLGMLIVGFYLGCSAGIYKKQYLAKRES